MPSVGLRERTKMVRVSLCCLLLLVFAVTECFTAKCTRYRLAQRQSPSKQTRIFRVRILKKDGSETFSLNIANADAGTKLKSNLATQTTTSGSIHSFQLNQWGKRILKKQRRRRSPQFVQVRIHIAFTQTTGQEIPTIAGVTIGKFECTAKTFPPPKVVCKKLSGKPCPTWKRQKEIGKDQYKVILFLRGVTSVLPYNVTIGFESDVKDMSFRWPKGDKTSKRKCGRLYHFTRKRGGRWAAFKIELLSKNATVLPTDAPVPSTKTPGPPTDTPGPPTDTPGPPTDTPGSPEPPTDAPGPPPGSPVPPPNGKVPPPPPADETEHTVPRPIYISYGNEDCNGACGTKPECDEAATDEDDQDEALFTLDEDALHFHNENEDYIFV